MDKEVVNPEISTEEEVKELKNNGAALTGFILGLVSIFLGFGLLPILAIIFSAIGLNTFDANVHKNKWQAIIGLILGILYTLAYMYTYGYI